MEKGRDLAQMKDWCRAIPKIELHAHLNGCIRDSTLAIEDFSAGNVVYLELRTMPKNNEVKGTTKRSYLKAVIDGLRSVNTIDVFFINSNSTIERFSEPIQNS